MTISEHPYAAVPVEVLRMANWTEGPPAERDALLKDYLGSLERMGDPQAGDRRLLDECLVVGLMHAAPEVRRQAQAAAARLSPELAADATGWTLGDPDETVRATALRSVAGAAGSIEGEAGSMGGAAALHALLASFGRSPELIASGDDVCVTATDARGLALARSLLSDTELVDAVMADLPMPLSADRMPNRLSLEGMRLVPAGRLRRGPRPDQRSPWGDPPAPAVAEALVEGFYMDAHPVTNDEYDAFAADVTERGHLWCHPDEPRDTDHTRSTVDDPRCAGDHPATGVNWYDAAAYAGWCGKRLPTEDEWERAARGDDHRRHPWGDGFRADQVRGLHSVTSADGDGGAGMDRQEWLRRLGDLPVESLPALTGPVGHHPGDESPFGVRDLCGNVWEWTSSRFLDGLPLAPNFGTMEPGDLWGEWSAEAAVRGGAWSSPPALLTAFGRAGKLLVTRSPEIGFRCVVSEAETVD
ncbi:formylglycine-generating enzyme family protein [Spirillospora sp. NPDC048911]|uniref:formylglycine-generating enzyme family protein n=1 Tax=Spirillospora sp. NPDC048911 TaxID=3364527 RepID=UPI003723DB41